MLSAEAPPPDLPRPCVVSPQKSSSSNIFNIDEKGSDNNQQQLEVDLLKPGLDDSSNKNPLPKFSIRDYVSSARGKDIKINWPFSQKNLQLCLKHGVTDVLPPFQSLDIVRNPSRMKCVDVKPPGLSGKNLPSEFQKEKEIESPTSHTYSEINTVPPVRTPCLEPEAVNLQRSSVEKPESSAQASGRVEKSTQNSVKSSKLIVKLSKITEPPSVEHSETMASKVCPVCKTFSSSSNTTLNAHIDQCLSGVSTMDWTSNSKVTKHRIKTRKTRLMVDVYTTAQHCTLEDLDRRNGTNWASNMVCLTQDLEACAKEKRKTKIDSCGDVEGKEKGAVYVDSSGTKFISLSKCSDLPFNSNAKDDCGTKKGKGMNMESKFPLSKKKKVLVKRHKPLKHSHFERTSFSCSHSHEVNDVHQNKLFREGGCEEEYTARPIKVYDQLKYNGMEMIKQSIGSKRTGFNQISDEHENQHPDNTLKNLRVKDGLSSLSHSSKKGTSDSDSPLYSDESPLLPSECHKRKESLPYSSRDECIKQPSLRTTAGLFVMKSGDFHGKRNNLAFRKCNIKQLRKDSPLVHKRHTDAPSDTENHDFSRSNKRNMICTGTVLNAESSFSNSTMSHQQAFSSGGRDLAFSRKISFDCVISPGHKKISSLRKKTHASVPELRDDSRRRNLNFKKPRLYYTSKSEEEAVEPRSAIRRDNQVEKLSVVAAQMEKAYVQSSMKPPRVLKIRKKRIFLNTGKEVDITSMESEISPGSDGRGVGKNIDSFTGGGVPASTSNALDAGKEAEVQDEFVCELSSERADGEAFIAFGRSLDSSFYELAGPSDVESVSQRYIEAYNDHCPDGLLLGDDPEIFYTDKVAKNIVSSDTQVVAEMDANEGQRNYFVDVDPIPIPGPPGSFLPSPGRLSSEELQGNSSLTTCRIQSSEDKHELMDMDSLDSPISSASLVSESASRRLNSVSVKKFSELSDGGQHQSLRHVSDDTIVESSNLCELASRVEGKYDHDGSRADLMLTETTPFSFKICQPCCCSRKGGFQSDAVDCRESQLLRRRSIASLALPAQEKHVGGELTEAARNSNMRSQTPPGNVPAPEAEKCVSKSQNSETKFPSSGDCEYPSPSTTNPVLRLMGKNLMVVNMDETLSSQTRSNHLNTLKDDHPRVLSNVDNGVTTVRFPNECYSVHQMLARVPSMFDHVQPSILGQHLDASSSNSFENTSSIRMQGLPLHPSAFVLSSKSYGGSLASSLNRHEYASGCNLNSEFSPKIGTDTVIAYGVEKVQTHGQQLMQTTHFSGYKSKEKVLVDELQKREPGQAINATHGESNMEVRGLTVGVSASMAFRHDSGHVNPALNNNQAWGYPLCNGSQAFHTSNIQVPFSKGNSTANSVQWNCTREGSAVLHPNSLTAPSLATGHPRSSLFHSPGFT